MVHGVRSYSLTMDGLPAVRPDVGESPSPGMENGVVAHPWSVVFVYSDSHPQIGCSFVTHMQCKEASATCTDKQTE